MSIAIDLSGQTALITGASQGIRPKLPGRCTRPAAWLC